MPYIYPNSPTYSHRQFDALAESFIRTGSVIDACAVSGIHERTAYRFLAMNDLRDEGQESWQAGRDAFQRIVAARRDRARRMRERGTPVKLIARRLDVCRRTVYRYLSA